MWGVGVFCAVIANANSGVCQKFIEHINALQTLQAAFEQHQGSRRVSGALLWKKPFYIRADISDEHTPLTIVVNAEGSFVMNRAFNTVTQADTRDHPLRKLLAKPLALSDVELTQDAFGCRCLRLLSCHGVTVFCDDHGHLKGWAVLDGHGEQAIFLRDAAYNTDLPDEAFSTPKAPTALERKEFWARHKNMQAFSV